MTKELLIVALIAVILYLYYQSSNQLNLNSNSQELQDLKQQVQHHQTLYQKRVERDLEVDQSTKIQQLQQKISDLETQLLNLAQTKIKGQKQAKNY